jgi:hypothetical protein
MKKGKKKKPVQVPRERSASQETRLVSQERRDRKEIGARSAVCVYVCVMCTLVRQTRSWTNGEKDWVTQRHPHHHHP